MGQCFVGGLAVLWSGCAGRGACVLLQVCLPLDVTTGSQACDVLLVQ
jgi:hypothetical protein